MGLLRELYRLDTVVHSLFAEHSRAPWLGTRNLREFWKLGKKIDENKNEPLSRKTWKRLKNYPNRYSPSYFETFLQSVPCATILYAVIVLVAFEYMLIWQL